MHSSKSSSSSTAKSNLVSKAGKELLVHTIKSVDHQNRRLEERICWDTVKSRKSDRTHRHGRHAKSKSPTHKRKYENKSVDGRERLEALRLKMKAKSQQESSKWDHTGYHELYSVSSDSSSSLSCSSSYCSTCSTCSSSSSSSEDEGPKSTKGKGERSYKKYKANKSSRRKSKNKRSSSSCEGRDGARNVESKRVKNGKRKRESSSERSNDKEVKKH